LIDTAGSEEFPMMRDMYYATSHAYVIVFSVNSVASVDRGIAIYNRIRQVKEDCESVTFLALNKCDLDTSLHSVTSTDIAQRLRLPLFPLALKPVKT